MKRTTISLPDDLAALVEREAARRGTSVSSIVRMSLTELLRGPEQRTVPWAGLVDDDRGPFARDLDEALEAEWADDIPGDR